MWLKYIRSILGVLFQIHDIHMDSHVFGIYWFIHSPLSYLTCHFPILFEFFSSCSRLSYLISQFSLFLVSLLFCSSLSYLVRLSSISLITLFHHSPLSFLACLSLHLFIVLDTYIHCDLHVFGIHWFSCLPPWIWFHNVSDKNIYVFK